MTFLDSAFSPENFESVATLADVILESRVTEGDHPRDPAQLIRPTLDPGEAGQVRPHLLRSLARDRGFRQPNARAFNDRPPES